MKRASGFLETHTAEMETKRLLKNPARELEIGILSFQLSRTGWRKKYDEPFDHFFSLNYIFNSLENGAFQVLLPWERPRSC